MFDYKVTLIYQDYTTIKGQVLSFSPPIYLPVVPLC